MKAITVYEFDELPSKVQKDYIETNRYAIAKHEGIIEQYRCIYTAQVKAQLSVIGFTDIELYFEFNKLSGVGESNGMSFSADGSDVIRKIIRKKCGSDLLTKVLMDNIIIDYSGAGEIYMYPSACDIQVNIQLYEIFDSRLLSRIRELLKEVLLEARNKYMELTDLYKKFMVEMYDEATSNKVLLDEIKTLANYYTKDGIKVE